MGLAGVVAEQPNVVALEALHRLGLIGRGLLQQLSILGVANIDAHQRDLGGLECSGVHIGHWRCVVQAAHHSPTSAGGHLVNRGRHVCARARGLANLDATAACHRRCLHLDRGLVLGHLQLVVVPAE